MSVASRVRRVAAAVGLGSLATTLVAGGGAAWYYASRLIQPPAKVPPRDPLVHERAMVVGARLRSVSSEEDQPTSFTVGDEIEVVLDGPGGHLDGTWGLEVEADMAFLRLDPLDPDDDDQVRPPSPRGEGAPLEELAGQGHPDDAPFDASPIRAATAGPATRPATVLAGTLDVTEPRDAVVDAYAWPHDPSLLGHPYSAETYASPLGPMPTWIVTPAEATSHRDVWAICVHGRAARRHESFRVVQPMLDRGLSASIISYRDDHEGLPSVDGRGHLGATEWEDVEAAVIDARQRGARRILLVGLSMGGALVTQFLRRSPYSRQVIGIILDAPVLDWSLVVDRAARERGLPRAVLPALLPSAMFVAGRRAGFRFAELRALDHLEAFSRPTLLIHGDADVIVPVEVSDALASARPDTVTYLRVPGAGHVQGWNVDRRSYERAVNDFVTRVTSPSVRRRLGRR